MSKPVSPDHGLISPSLPRTRLGTDEYASGCSSGRRLPARTSTTLCTWRPPDCWTQETQACHEPSRSCISQASRWPTIPPLISTIGGHQGASRRLIRLVFEFQFYLSRLSCGEARPHGAVVTVGASEPDGHADLRCVVGRTSS